MQGTFWLRFSLRSPRVGWRGLNSIVAAIVLSRLPARLQSGSGASRVAVNRFGTEIMRVSAAKAVE
jgi:hypothetical protein